MGVFRPGLYLEFKAGAAPPPARNLIIKDKEYFVANGINLGVSIVSQ